MSFVVSCNITRLCDKVILLFITIFNYDVGNKQDQEDGKKGVGTETVEENLTISQNRANCESDAIFMEARDQNIVATEGDVGAPAELEEKRPFFSPVHGKEDIEFDMKIEQPLKKRSNREMIPGFHLRSIVRVHYGVIC